MRTFKLKSYFSKYLFITFAMISSCLSPAHALKTFDTGMNEVLEKIEELENVDLSIDSTFSLFDLNGNSSFDLILFEEGGYAIVTKNSKELSEYSLDSNITSPYSEYLNTSNSLIYGGPFNYFIEDANGNVYDLNSNEKIELVQNDHLLEITEKMIDGSLLPELTTNGGISTLATEPNSWTGISSSRFSRYNNSGWVNKNNTCGPHSAAVMIAYYQDYYPSLIAFDSSVRSKDSTSPGTLITKLINSTSSPTATTPQKVGVGVATFLNTYNTAGSYITCYYSSSGTWSTATSKISSGKPVCIGLSGAGGLHKYGWHWVTAYAYGTDSDGNGYYRCHTNWSGEYAVTIRTSWTIGIAYLNK